MPAIPFMAILGNRFVQLGGAVALVLLALWLWGNHREAQGRDAVWAEIRAAEAKALKKASEAATNADSAQEAATARFEAYSDTMEKEIDNAEKAGDSPLDALFGSM